MTVNPSDGITVGGLVFDVTETTARDKRVVDECMLDIYIVPHFIDKQQLDGVFAIR